MLDTAQYIATRLAINDFVRDMSLAYIEACGVGIAIVGIPVIIIIIIANLKKPR